MKSPSASDVKSSFPQLDSAQATVSDADVRTDSVAKSLTCADEVGRSPMAICQKVISGYGGCRMEPSNCFILVKRRGGSLNKEVDWRQWFSGTQGGKV